MSHTVEWVEDKLGALARHPPRRGARPLPTLPLNHFQRAAVELLAEGMNTGIYNVSVNWEKVEWIGGFGVCFTMFTGGLSTWDFNQLTRLVIGAHDRCIRVVIMPCAPNHVRILMHQREREGGMAKRHPTIEQAIADFRASVAAKEPA